MIKLIFFGNFRFCKLMPHYVQSLDCIVTEQSDGAQAAQQLIQMHM